MPLACVYTVYTYVHTLRAHMPLHMSIHKVEDAMYTQGRGRHVYIKSRTPCIHKVEDAMKTCPADHVAYIKFLMDYGTHFTNKVV